MFVSKITVGSFSPEPSLTHVMQPFFGIKAAKGATSRFCNTYQFISFVF
jgi:hypothetical protein